MHSCEQVWPLYRHVRWHRGSQDAQVWTSFVPLATCTLNDIWAPDMQAVNGFWPLAKQNILVRHVCNEELLSSCVAGSLKLDGSATMVVLALFVILQAFPTTSAWRDHSCCTKIPVLLFAGGVTDHYPCLSDYTCLLTHARTSLPAEENIHIWFPQHWPELVAFLVHPSCYKTHRSTCKGPDPRVYVSCN